ncbi:MAG: methyltransferase domain-containing protein [Chloroflexota bacterium]
MTNSLATSTVGVELLDDPAADPRMVAQSLRSIALSNRWFGGRAAMRFGLARALERTAPGALTLFDVGTGAADLPRDAEQWGRSRGYSIRGFGIDRSYPAAQVARCNGVATVVGCAGTLPLRDRSVDLVLVSQVIHHLTQPAATQLLSESRRVARRAVIVCDLRRARLAQAGFWLGSRVLGFDAATRADGITSVRRGYLVPELGELMAAAGMAAPVWARPGYRLVAVWRRD